jgi:hypothetical protein
MTSSDIDIGLVNFDFVRFFPQKFWVSNWATDETYPAGYCYKILAVRDEMERKVELVLIRSHRDGTKEELHRAAVPIGEVDEAASIFSVGLAKKFGLDFEEQDFSAVRTLEEFRALSRKYGWALQNREA